MAFRKGGKGTTGSFGDAEPAGSDKEVQFNDDGEFGGDSSFTFDKSSKEVVLSDLQVDNDAVIEGNLTVRGTTVSVNSESLNVGDNHIYLNAFNTSTLSQTGGIVVNIGAVSPLEQATVVSGAFIAGIASTSNPTVVTSQSDVFSVNDIVQIADNEKNDGVYEVLSHVGTLLTVRGIGLTPTVEKWTNNQFTADTDDAATITKVNVSVLLANDNGTGFFGEATGNETSIAEPFVFNYYNDDFTLPINQATHNFTVGQVLYKDAEPSAFFPGITGSNFSTPDNTANDFSVDLDFRVEVALDKWTGPKENFIGKFGGTNTSYLFDMASGVLGFAGSTDGTTIDVIATASVPLTFEDDSRNWVRVTRVQSSGVITFYTSDDNITYTQVGIPKTSGMGALFDSTTSLILGAAFLTDTNAIEGRIYRMLMKSSIGGTTTVDFNPADATGSGAFNSVTTGEEWTPNGSARIDNIGGAGLYSLAKADSLSTANAIGIVSKVIDANNFVLAFAGYHEIFSNLIDGEMYYLSSTIAGGITEIPPAIERPILNTTSPTSGYIFTSDVHSDATHDGTLPYLVGPDTDTNHSYEYNSIQDAVNAAETAGIPATIYIMSGNYSETGNLITIGGGANNASITLRGQQGLSGGGVNITSGGLSIENSVNVSHAVYDINFGTNITYNCDSSAKVNVEMYNSTCVKLIIGTSSAASSFRAINCIATSSASDSLTINSQSSGPIIDIKGTRFKGGVDGSGSTAPLELLMRDCLVLTSGFNLDNSGIAAIISDTDIVSSGAIFSVDGHSGTIIATGGVWNRTTSGNVIIPDATATFSYSNITTIPPGVLNELQATHLASDGVVLKAAGSGGANYLDDSGSYSAPPNMYNTNGTLTSDRTMTATGSNSFKYVLATGNFQVASPSSAPFDVSLSSGDITLLTNTGEIHINSQGSAVDITASTHIALFAGEGVGVKIDSPTSTFQVNGSNAVGYKTSISDIDSSDTNIMAIINTSTTRTATILNADITGATGRIFTIKDEGGQAGTNNITVTTQDIVLQATSIGGSGTLFTSASPHSFVVGQTVIQSNFSNPNYNGTFVVNTVDTTTTYIINSITFGVLEDNGNVELPLDGAAQDFLISADHATEKFYSNGTAIWTTDILGAAGSDSQVQYNDGGTFGASSNFTFNDATNALTLENGPLLVPLGDEGSPLDFPISTAGVQLFGDDGGGAADFVVDRQSNQLGNAARLHFRRGRQNNSVINQGDYIGLIDFDAIGYTSAGPSPTTGYVESIFIRAETVGVVGDGDTTFNLIPTDLAFYATRDGISGLVEAFRIGRNRQISINRGGQSLTSEGFPKLEATIHIKGTTSASNAANIFLDHQSNSAAARSQIHLRRKTDSGAVQSGWDLGSIFFDGTDVAGASGTFYAAAEILAQSEAIFTLADTPGRLVFLTTPAGSNSPTEKMRIDNAGNVGIGTTTPATLLDVDGTATVNNLKISTILANQVLYNSSSSSVVGNSKFKFDDNNVLVLGDGTGGSGNAGAIEVHRITPASAEAQDPNLFAAFHAVGNDSIHADIFLENINNGGAQPTDPGEPPRLWFDRSRVTGITAVTVNNGNSLGQIVWRGFVSTGGAIYRTGAQLECRVADTGTISSSSMPTDMLIKTSSDGSVAPTEKMRITAAGNVGIGAATPTSLLQVDGSVAVGYKSSTGDIDSSGTSIMALRDTTAVHTATILNADITGTDGRLFTIKDEGGSADSFNITITTQDISLSATSNLSPGTLFTTASPHSFVVGQTVIQTGFTTNTAYNDTFVITGVPSTTTYEVSTLTFNTPEGGGNVELPLDGSAQDPVIDAPHGVAQFYSNGLSIWASI